MSMQRKTNRQAMQELCQQAKCTHNQTQVWLRTCDGASDERIAHELTRFKNNRKQITVQYVQDTRNAVLGILDVFLVRRGSQVSSGQLLRCVRNRPDIEREWAAPVELERDADYRDRPKPFGLHTEDLQVADTPMTTGLQVACQITGTLTPRLTLRTKELPQKITGEQHQARRLQEMRERQAKLLAQS